MNRNIILIALLGLLFVSKAVAQSVTVEAKIDSLQILIGEQAKVQLQVAMDAKQIIAYYLMELSSFSLFL